MDPTSKSIAWRALQSLMGEVWALPAHWLATMIHIATRQNPSIEAVQAELGVQLDNTRAVAVRDGVAVIPISGPLFRHASLFSAISGATSYEELAQDFSTAMADPNIKAIVLDIDSPGGQVNGVSDLAKLIAESEGKEVVAHIGGQGLSAAYWLAAAADKVVVSDTAIVGGLGVVFAISRCVGDDDNCQEVEIVSTQTPRKRANPFTEDGQKQFQTMADDLAEVFLNFVGDRRGVARDKVAQQFGAGSAFIGAKAASVGLADSVGTLEATVQGLMTGPSQPATLLAPAAKAPRLDLAAIADIPDALGDITKFLAEHGSLRIPVKPAAASTADPVNAAKPAPVAIITHPSKEPTLDEPTGGAPDAAATIEPHVAGSGTPDPAKSGAWTAGQTPPTEGRTQEEINAIMAIADDHPTLYPKVGAWMKAGKTVEEIQSLALQELRGDKPAQPAGNVMGHVSPKERRTYNLAGTILAIDDRQKGKNPDYDWGYERELSEQVAEDSGFSPDGFLLPLSPGATSLPHIPDFVMRQHGMDPRAQLRTDTANQGQELVFTEPGEFIDLLRNAMKVRGLGAVLLDGLVGDIAMPRQTSAVSGSWVAEDPGSDVADSILNLDQVTLTPKTYQASTSYTRQMLAQALRNVSLEALVRMDMALVHALAVDSAAINGTGASNQPTGIRNQTGVAVVAIGTNGGAPTWSHMIQLEEEVAIDNADVGVTQYLTNPKVRRKLKETQRFASTDTPVWTDDQRINGMNAEVSNQVPSNLTKGSGTSLSNITFGVWNQLLIGQWAAFDVIVDPYRLKKQGIVEVTSFQMVDMAVRHGESFAIVEDADTT